MARQIIRQERFIVNSFKNASTLIEQKLLCKSIAKTDAETVNAYNELKESVIQSIANISDEWTNVKDKELVVTTAGKELIVSEWHYKNIVVTITSDARNTNSVIFDDTYLITRSDFEAPIEVKAAVKYDTEVGPQIFVTARIVLNRYDVATGELVDTVINHVPADGILYFNNGNAPVMEDYDFVMMDGIRYEDAREGGTFSVWYVQHSVADPTATTLSAIGTVTTNNDVKNTYSLELTNSTSLVSTSGRNTLTEPKRINTSNLIDASALFKYGYYITSIPDLDTSNVTNMREMFFHCDRLQEIPYMDTSSVINMENIFAYTSLLQGPAIDTSSVTNASYMFYNCGSLTDIPVYDFSNVTNLQYAFSGCKSLVDLSDLAITASNPVAMFADCTALEHLGDMNFTGQRLNTLKYYNRSGSGNSTGLDMDVFYNCTKIKSFGNITITNNAYDFLPTISYFKSTLESIGNIISDGWGGTTPSSFFSSCTALRTVGDISCANFTTLSSLFAGCTALESVGNITATAATQFSNMFMNCSSLTQVGVITVNANATYAASNFTDMFTGCSSLTEVTIANIQNTTVEETLIANFPNITFTFI